MLEQIRRTIGEYNFAGQYQQAPSPLGGGLVKAAWFRHYAPGELPQTFDRVVQSWDTANKATELSDFSVCTTSNAGIFELYRQRAEELRRGQMPGPPVRLRAPSGVSHVQLFSGIHRAVAPDGTVEMTPDDAAPLLRAGVGECRSRRPG